MRGIVICTVTVGMIIATWWFGGSREQSHLLACGFVFLAGCLWLIESTSTLSIRTRCQISTLLVPFVAALGLGVWHLLPADQSLVLSMEHARFADERVIVAEDSQATNSLYPPGTRFRLGVLVTGFLALAVCCEPIRSLPLLRLVLGIITINGVLIALYGIGRQLQGSRMIFDLVRADSGFSTFMNRNQAAGFLNLSFAAGLGWLVLLTPANWWSRSSKEDAPIIPRRRWELSRFLASLSGEQLLAGVSLIVLAGGIMMTMSRGGIGSFLLAVSMVAMLMIRRFGLRAAASTLIVGVGIALTIYLGEWTVIRSRLETLTDPAESLSGRMTHWHDTLYAVHDFPWAGTGWGTYGYANQPYQRHHTEMWFINADNLYVEALIEGGLLGLTCFLLVWFILLGAVIRLMRSSSGLELKALALAGMVAWVTQVVHAVTDFGLLRPSNGLLFAILSGLVVSAAMSSVRLNPAGRWLVLADLPGWWRLGLAAICLVLVGVGVREVSRAAACAETLRAVPELGELIPAVDSVSDVDHFISSLEDVLRSRPDDAPTHERLAELWIQRYRLQLLEEMRQYPELESRSDQSLWRFTPPLNLHRIFVERLIAYGPDEEDQIRNWPHVQENLVPAVRHLREARQVCPLSRRIDYLLGMLGFVDDVDPQGEASIRRAMFSSPARASRLRALGTLAWLVSLDELALQCFQQAFHLSDESAPRAWALLRTRISDERILNEVFPPRPELLLALAEVGNVNDVGRDLLMSRLEQLVESGDMEPASRGRLLQALGDCEQATEWYERHLAEFPHDLEIRIRTVRCYVSLLNFESANRHLRIALRSAPDNPELNRMQQDILRQRLEQNL